MEQQPQPELVAGTSVVVVVVEEQQDVEVAHQDEETVVVVVGCSFDVDGNTDEKCSELGGLQVGVPMVGHGRPSDDGPGHS